MSLKAKAKSINSTKITVTSCASTAATERIDFTNLKVQSPIQLKGTLVKRQKNTTSTLGRWDNLLAKTKHQFDLFKGSCSPKRLIENSRTKRVISPENIKSRTTKPQSIKIVNPVQTTTNNSDLFKFITSEKSRKWIGKLSKKVAADKNGKIFKYRNVTSEANFLCQRINYRFSNGMKIDNWEKEQVQTCRRIASPERLTLSQINLPGNNSTDQTNSAGNSPIRCRKKVKDVEGNLLTGCLTPKGESPRRRDQSLRKANDSRLLKSQIQLEYKLVPVVSIDLTNTNRNTNLQQRSHSVKKLLTSFERSNKRKKDNVSLYMQYEEPIIGKKRLDASLTRNQNSIQEQEDISKQIKGNRPQCIPDQFRSSFEFI